MRPILLLLLLITLTTHAQTLTQVADGKTDATPALQAAINRAAAARSPLRIPAGRYRVATLHLPSHLHLYLERGAVLLADTVLAHYPAQNLTGEKDRQPYHLLVADSAEDLRITGPGIIDGQGPAFWYPARPSRWHFYRELPQRVSPMLELRRCRGVTIQGITLQNSPGWTLHLFACDSVMIDSLQIKNELFGPNTDGIDINGCQQVRIRRSQIRAGDDAIVCKTTRDARPCRDITVEDCQLETNCAALKLGTESYHDFSRIRFSRCQVLRSTRMIELTICDGGHVSGIHIERISGQTNGGWPLGRPLVINLNQRTDASSKSSIDGVVIEHCQMRSDGRILIGAAPKLPPIKGLIINDLRHELAMLDDPQPIAATLEGDRTFAKALPALRSARAAIALENLDSARLSGITVVWPRYPVPQDWRLLQSTWPALVNPGYYKAPKATAAALRSGRVRPPFTTLYQAHCPGLALQPIRQVGRP